MLLGRCALAVCWESIRRCVCRGGWGPALLASARRSCAQRPAPSPPAADMLNYFLLYLAGPERKSFKVKDPEKYFFRPRELLQQIIQVRARAAAAAAAAAAEAAAWAPSLRTCVQLAAASQPAAACCRRS